MHNAKVQIMCAIPLLSVSSKRSVSHMYQHRFDQVKTALQILLNSYKVKMGCQSSMLKSVHYSQSYSIFSMRRTETSSDGGIGETRKLVGDLQTGRMSSNGYGEMSPIDDLIHWLTKSRQMINAMQQRWQQKGLPLEELYDVDESVSEQEMQRFVEDIRELQSNCSRLNASLEGKDKELRELRMAHLTALEEKVKSQRALEEHLEWYVRNVNSSATTRFTRNSLCRTSPERKTSQVTREEAYDELSSELYKLHQKKYSLEKQMSEVQTELFSYQQNHRSRYFRLVLRACFSAGRLEWFNGERV